MHHLRSIRALLLLVVVTAMFGFCLPSASSQPAPQVIRLLWIQTSSHPDGKKETWTSQLLNATRQFGKPAGAKVGAEVGISRGRQFTGGIKLPGGVLEYSGKDEHRTRGAIVVPVVDGSGIFAGVTGTYTRSRGDTTHPASWIVVLQLQYD
ncbi:MAG TPA: hypothetical protein VGI77_03760 [Gaiellaceae bacterium]|jgi:hypothetical protein